MDRYDLGFISDEDIYRHVKETVESYRRKIDLNIHKKLLQNAGNGWRVDHNGFDICNTQKHIYVLFSNIITDATPSNLNQYIIIMQQELLKNKDAICYIVDTSDSHIENNSYCYAIDNEIIYNPRIQIISMKKFYSIIFNKDETYGKTVQAINFSIKDILSHVPFT